MSVSVDFQVISSVLADKSPVLRQLLKTECRETTEGVIHLAQLEQTPFQQLGKYLTEGAKPQLHHMDDILQLYHTAHGSALSLSPLTQSTVQTPIKS